MPIVEQAKWKSWEEKNIDPYSKACVDVARCAMEILDEEPGGFDTHNLICRAEKRAGEDGITGFMAGCVAQMVSACHSRGDEFRQKWNLKHQIHDEGEKANQSGGVLNPAVLTMEGNNE